MIKCWQRGDKGITFLQFRSRVDHRDADAYSSEGAASTALRRNRLRLDDRIAHKSEEVKHEMSKKKTQSHDRIGLKLTQAERSLLLEGLTLLPSVYEEAVNGTPAKEPVMLKLDDLDELGGYIAAAANHTQDKKKGKKLEDRKSVV